MLTNSPMIAKLLNGKTRRGDGVSSKIGASNKDKAKNGKIRGP